jgi:CheY-like chemotaxis protein
VQMNMKPDDPLKVDIDHILESANRAAALTGSLLAFSRKQVMQLLPADLSEIIKRVERFLRRIIGEDVELKTVLRPGALIVNADFSQIEQVLMNLATNARDAMPKGGVFTIETSTVVVDDEYVRVNGVGEPGTYAMISVSDTGMGMDDKTRKRIFEPFYSTKEVGKGTGLGLSIIYGIIRQHNGFINVYSEEGKGTTFNVYLPLIEDKAAPSQKAGATGVVQGGTETILVAEDDPSIRDLTRVVLESFGYSVITAGDGEEAVLKFRENRDKIKLVVLDLIMPKKNGKEAHDEIIKMKPGSRAFFLSGYTMEMIGRMEIEEGLELVRKPFVPNDLLRKVREMLDR